MQKIINVLAVASAAVSVAVVGLGGYVYLNREAIIEDVKEKALGGLGGSLGGDLPIGAPDLASPTPQASAPNVPSGGLGVPTF
jgi:hypothetical protein